MLVVKKNCKTCEAVKKDKRLLNRLYNSRYYLGRGETLSSIHRDYKDVFSIAALKNHCQKHQFIDSVAYNAAKLKQADKLAEDRIVRKAIKAQEAVQSVIDKGMQRLEDEEITVSTAEMLRASQIKITAESKEKDRELKMVEMIAFFASEGSNEKIYIDTDDTTS